MKLKKIYFQRFGFFFGLVIFLWLYLVPFSPGHPEASNMAAIAALMAIWWIAEALPLAITSLIPLLFFPLLGVDSTNATASQYVNSTIFVYVGGFLIALAMQKWNLHKRISLNIIKFTGGTPAGITLGFMISSAFISMFISNVATTVMLLPIGLAVIYNIEEIYGNDRTHKLSSGLMLGIAYAASIGGIGTIIGTAPNLIFQRVFKISFPQAPPITFGNWFLVAFPIALVMLISAWLVITKITLKPDKSLRIGKEIIDMEYRKLGKFGFEEKVVLTIFLVTGFLWMFRTQLDIGFMTIQGWSSLFPFAKKIDDATVVMFTTLFFFIIPAREKKGMLLDETCLEKIPWGVILIFGGGFALAEGFTKSGLSEVAGNSFNSLTGIAPIWVVTVSNTILTFLTELTSNTATTNTLLPILAAIAKHIEVNPILLMMPATISASFAFMLPVATPPNAIVYGSGRIKSGEMLVTGIILNIVGIIVATIIFLIVAPVVFNFDLYSIPIWSH